MKKLSPLLLVIALVPAFAFAVSGKEKEAKADPIEEVSPNEDLMREHGVLNRLLLIYQEISRRIDNHEPFPLQVLTDAAQIARDFLENYHERLEEQYVFPKFESAKQLVDLVRTLKEQHEAGRHLTDYILAHSKKEILSDEIERLILSDYLKLYVRMFRPHEAREDTVLFPAFRKLVSKEEYRKLGDLFEDKEHELFGQEGFETIVGKIGKIEEQLNIYNLSEFTPQWKGKQ